MQIEVLADDYIELERLIKIKEEEGWSREGKGEIVHSTPDDNGAVMITVSQTMTKLSEEEDLVPPQD